MRLAGLAPEPITASASISSTYAGSISAEVCTMLVAGQISPKTSLWARAISSKSSEVGDGDAGTDDVIEAPAGLDQSGSDDLQGPPGLGIGACGRGAIRVPADRRPHEDLIAYANRP